MWEAFETSLWTYRSATDKETQTCQILIESVIRIETWFFTFTLLSGVQALPTLYLVEGFFNNCRKRNTDSYRKEKPKPLLVRYSFLEAQTLQN